MGRPGSSPLARGLRRRQPADHRDRRIIPARAGFTVNVVAVASAAADHPRSRGVYSAAREWLGWGFGSSPLARGLLCQLAALIISHGIIPARAGFTLAAARNPREESDHPRSRGVYGLMDADGFDPCGSSPLARGLRHSLAIAAGAAVGSSPLARGLHPRTTEPGAGARIIPARAGFT